MVSKFSGKKEEAVDFIKFLLKEESQEIFYKVSGYYPVVNSFYEEPEYLKKYPEIEEFKRFMKAGVHRPSHIDYTRFSNLMSFYFKKAIQEEISVKEALRECTNAIQAERMIIKEF